MQIQRILNRTILPVIILICFVWIGSTNAQEQFDLKKAMLYALEHHASIKVARIEVHKGQQLVREALSFGYPQLHVNSHMVNNPSIRQSIIPANTFPGMTESLKVAFGTNWNAQASLAFSQLAFDRVWLMGLKSTYAVTDFYKLVLDKTREDVVYEVAKLYYQIQLAKTQEGLLSANLDKINGLLHATTLQYKNGFAKKVDVDRLDVQRVNLETQKLNLDLQIEQALQALKFSMNLPLETEIVLTDTISRTSDIETGFLSFQPSYKQKPDVLILQKQQELYGLDAKMWKAGFFPRAVLFANYNYEWQGNNLNQFSEGNNWTRFSQIGLQINIPIFDGFFKDSKIQTAQLNGIKTGNELGLVLLGMQLKHELAVSTMKVQQNTLRSVERNQIVAEEVFNITQERYKQGIAPITELLDAESSLRQAQSNYITTLAQIKLAEIDLLHTNGLLIKLVE